MLGKIKGRWKRGQQWKRWLDGIIDSSDMNLGKLRQMVKDSEGQSSMLQFMGSQEVGHD